MFFSLPLSDLVLCRPLSLPSLSAILIRKEADVRGPTSAYFLLARRTDSHLKCNHLRGTPTADTGYKGLGYSAHGLCGCLRARYRSHPVLHRPAAVRCREFTGRSLQSYNISSAVHGCNWACKAFLRCPDDDVRLLSLMWSVAALHVTARHLPLCLLWKATRGKVYCICPILIAWSQFGGGGLVWDNLSEDMAWARRWRTCGWHSRAVWRCQDKGSDIPAS